MSGLADMPQACILCGSEGTSLYDGLTDMTFESEMKWTLIRCSNRDCGLIWLSPMPTPNTAMQAYEEGYYTHALGKERLFSRIKSWIKTGRFGKSLGFLNYLHDFPKGLLLDVGCGNGRYLYEMRKLGWQVEGLDPDPLAVRLAIDEYKIKVHETTLENAVLEEESYDVLTLNHILEHVTDPVSCLSKCYRLLKPGGQLVVRTPNAVSLGHRIFRESWQSLDIPRHCFIYSKGNLRFLAEKAGFNVLLMKTVPRDANTRYVRSAEIKDQKCTRTSSNARDTGIAAMGVIFLLVEFLALTLNSNHCEELVSILVK